MFRELRPALVALVLFSTLTGVAYPVIVTVLSAALFPSQAHGSLIRREGGVVGSALVGQSFTQPEYLWGRPSAIALPYDARTSSGSNLGPGNPLLDSLVRARIATLRAADPSTNGAVPVELATASASGLDPELSPGAALFQVRRIARSRAVDSATVAAVVWRYALPRTFGILGEPRVNVLRVNLALDSLSDTRRASH